MERVEIYCTGDKIAKMFGVNYDHFMLTLDVIESPEELYECKRKGGCHNDSLIECICWNNEHGSKTSIEESISERIWHVAMVYGVAYEEAKLTKPYYVTNDRRCFDNVAVIVKVERTYPKQPKIPFTIADISERTVKDVDRDNVVSPAIRIKSFNDLKDLLTPFWPKGLIIIIWFILFVFSWGFIFYKLPKY